MAELTADEIRSRVEKDWQRIVDLLGRKIALRSVSAEGITAGHMKRSAQFVAEELAKVGVDTKVVQSHNPDGTPGAWEVIGSRIVDPDAPTVLLYAHHDVQPVPDPAAWDTDPFVATEIDTRLYGRGAADDGGGIAIHSGALAALGDDLKVNVKVFIEGEEEMGSPSFIPFIEEHRDEFDSDVIVVADSGNWSADIPSLTTSLRGNTCVDVTVKVLEHPVHSGQYGGPILDANTLAAMLIASMYDANGDLAVPGLAAQEPVGGLQRDLDEGSVREDAGIVDGYRLAGTGSIASRLWTKPSATVIGFDAHPVEGSFNVISPETTFRLSLRIAPGQRPEEAQAALVDFLKSHAPFGAEVSVDAGDGGMGWAMDPNAVATKDALEAMEEAFGVAPINKGEGGSIPFIPELQRIFPEAQVLVTGPEDPKANAHSPNESISLPGLKNNVITEALLLAKLGK
ncbi:MAG: dipeptidase [Bifidobacterium scardovii]|uniref:dipeptidase n=1 Tax=Bifidobacterium scardovii TaxID=158787 RepID=UPI0006689860|nr:dipeptidase [Bifidobacterium scardovii]MBS6946865.1 dipeptidase [Bifidobacterium scardovii]MDU2422443.1 dipeptidase [Bifidobacterium scardovii]MDU3735574.1 dipeptidase [Bifidobacterium scardovii]MDU5297426.1 dipeptidase [Bifidobacterium scardovii]MDU5610596.1 dipeptidase [Bifidobacterium scardovii]